MFRVCCDRLIEVIDRFLHITAGTLVPEIATFEIKLVRLEILGWPRRNGMFLGAGEFRFERVGNRLGNFAFNCKNVSQLAIVGIGSEMRVCRRFN